MKRFAAAGALLLALAALPTHAQAPTVVEVTQVIADTYPDVTAVVGVRDANGALVGGLTAADISARDGDEPVAVTGVQAAVNANVGVAVVFVMDTSGSMQGEPLALTQEAAVRFVEALLPADGATVVPFADSVGAPGPITGDKAALTATLRGLQSGGGTALHDAVITGLRAAKTAPLPRKVVVLLTDGQEYGNSETTAEQTLQEASLDGVPVFAIGVGEDINTAYLTDLAQRSGGRFIAAPAPADIPAVYDGIGLLLRSQYLVRLRLNAPADGGTSSLHLTVTAAGAASSGSLSFARPALVTPAPEPSPTPLPSPEATATSGGGSGGMLIAVVAAALAGVLVVGVVGVVGRRRLQRRDVKADSEVSLGRIRKRAPVERKEPPAPEPLLAAPLAKARLTVVDGPDRGATVSFSGEAATLGSDADCTLRLSYVEGTVAGRQARIWLREGRFMLHHLAGRRATTLVGGQSVTWVVLEDGDEVVIGPHRVRFQSP